MQATQTLARDAVKELVIDGRAFPTHAADQADFFKLQSLSRLALVQNSTGVSTGPTASKITKLKDFPKKTAPKRGFSSLARVTTLL